MRIFSIITYSVFALQTLYGTTFEFIERKNQSEVDFTWTEKKKDNEIVLEGSKPEGTTTILCDSGYFFNFMDFKSNEERFRVQREGAVLYVERTLGKRTIRKRIEVGREPWVQQFWFGLRPLLNSNRESFRFSIIDPDSCKRHRMIATKQKIESIEVLGKRYDAQHIKITLQGFKSMFWSGHIWFDVESKACLKYQADEGPNTPLTTVLLKKVIP